MSTFFSRFTMKVKLMIAFMLIGLAPLVVLSSISIYQSYQKEMDTIALRNQQLAVALANDLDEMVKARVMMMTMVSQLTQMQSMDPQQQVPVLKLIRQQYGDLASIIAINLEGKQIARNDDEAMANVGDRGWFQEVLKGKPVAISESLIAKVLGGPCVIIGLPVKNANGVLVGELSGTLDLAAIGQKAKAVKTGQTGYAFVTDNTGKLIAHPYKDKVIKQTDVKNLEVVQKGLAKATGYSLYEIDGEKQMAGYASVPSAGWTVVVQMPEREALADVQKHLLLSAGVLVGVIFLVILVALFVARSVSQPLQRMVEATKVVATGDLTETLSVEGQDEISQLSRAFNSMVTQLKELIQQIHMDAERLAAFSEELNASAEQSAQASDQVAASITNVAQDAENQVSVAGDVAEGVRQMSASIQHMAANAGLVVDQAGEAANKAEDGRNLVNKAFNQIVQIEKTVEVSARVVTKLGSRSKEIGQIVEVISSIAGQTNLLALNAAIEAARAGEQGRGFAVVAEEVRKLAEQSEEATKRIGHLITEIQSDTDQAVLAMNQGTREVKMGVELAGASERSFQTISSLVNRVSGQVKEITTTIEQVAAGSKQIVESVGCIDSLSKKVAGEAQTVSAATQEQSASMEEISTSSQMLLKLSNDLLIAVSKFRL